LWLLVKLNVIFYRRDSRGRRPSSEHLAADVPLPSPCLRNWLISNPKLFEHFGEAFLASLSLLLILGEVVGEV
jgi:hypothetical protein